jgi:hypothetical protein
VEVELAAAVEGAPAAADLVAAAPAAVDLAVAALEAAALAAGEAEPAAEVELAAAEAADLAAAAGSIAPSKPSLARRPRRTSRLAPQARSGTPSVTSVSSGTAAFCPIPP